MLDITLLTIAGVLAGAVVVTETEAAVRLGVAMSFGVLVGLFWLVVIPFHAEASDIFRRDDIND